MKDKCVQPRPHMRTSHLDLYSSTTDTAQARARAAEERKVAEAEAEAMGEELIREEQVELHFTSASLYRRCTFDVAGLVASLYHHCTVTVGGAGEEWQQIE